MGQGKDEKGGSDVEIGTCEYGKEREDEVRCRVQGGGEGGVQWVEKQTGREGSVKEQKRTRKCTHYVKLVQRPIDKLLSFGSP